MPNLLFFLIFAAVAFISGCSKPDPAPHLSDPIYQDMSAQSAEAAAALAQAKKDLDEAKKDIEKVIPQTGQIKFARKRIAESENRVNVISQQVQYWEIRLKDRELYVKKAYIEKFKKKEKWDNSEEVKQYMLEKKFRQRKMGWDAKDRIKEYQELNAPPKAPAAGGH